MHTPFIYLDYNASTPIDPEVVETMQPFLSKYYGNPSSIHLEGTQAKEAIDLARSQVANLLSASPDEIIFTSGGTESNNLAIVGVATANRNKGKHIITSNIEHPAVTEVCKHLERQGFLVTYIGVDAHGKVKIEEIKNSITPQTILISIMHANNEIGSIQPIEEIGLLAQEKNILFHTDAAQSIGKIPTNVNELNVDLLSLAGHKFYAPKGVGALYIKRGTSINKILHGASHEFNLRPGTENALLISGLGKAAEIAGRDLHKNTRQMRVIRDYLLEKLNALNIEAVVNGDLSTTLPNTLNMSIRNLDANKIIYQLRNRLALSAGSACHAGSENISNVLKATLPDLSYANGTFRFSVGKHTTKTEIDMAVKIFEDTISSQIL